MIYTFKKGLCPDLCVKIKVCILIVATEIYSAFRVRLVSLSQEFTYISFSYDTWLF